jgi:hypothetical protein
MVPSTSLGIKSPAVRIGGIFVDTPSRPKALSMKLDGPHLQCLLSSIAREASERPSRRRQSRQGVEVQYHCTTL